MKEVSRKDNNPDLIDILWHWNKALLTHVEQSKKCNLYDGQISTMTDTFSYRAGIAL